MDKMALADRFDGYSNVFASDSNIGIDLKAMADTLRSMPEEKFAKVINADFEEEAFLTSMKGPNALEKRTPQMERKTPAPAHVPGGIVPTDPQFAGVPKGQEAKIISDIANKRKLNPKVIESIYSDFMNMAKQASMPGVMDVRGPGALKSRTPQSDRETPAHVPGGIVSTDPMFAGVPKGQEAKMIADIAKKREMDPKIIQSVYDDFLSAFKSKAASDSWTKLASDHVAKNLIRDVLGMDKSICCDTKRHLDKKQMPDATKTQETKGAVARQEDTGAALKPEQVPHLDEVLNSDMYKKSQGKVVKEASTEENPDAKAAEPQEINADETADDVAKRLKKIEDEKKKAELKAKSRPESKEKEAQPEVEANTVVAEGVEFDNVMMEAEANDEDVKKLSALFE